jgi:hypothetical protein
MLYCMALTKTELEFLSQEVLRVLKPNGLNIYTVRNQKDKHYRLGVHLGEDIYQVGDYGVHFFNQDMIKSLATGYELLDVEEFAEGDLPRQLYYVLLKAVD